MSLKELQDSVVADAALHLPDIYYDTNSSDHDVKFEALLLSSLIDENEADVAGLRITTDRQDPQAMRNDPYMFTRWSRSQLLSLFGTKEKWFSSVGLDRQVEELNARLHVFSSYRIRLMKAVDEDFPVRVIRGLVSSEYAEIKNTEIMESVISKADPESKALRGYSGITDRAFYAYIMSPSPITIPGTSFFGYPGAVVKNSEVGYTSLWTIPTLVMRQKGVPVVFESKHVLKRIHRGRADLNDAFEKAFKDCAVVWADMTAQIPKLASRTYGTEDAAVAALDRMLESAGARRDLIAKASAAYKAKVRQHTALDVFEAITEACAEVVDRDDLYDAGAIAGSVLYKLLF